MPREDARVQRDAEETGAVPRSKPMSEDQDATTAPAGDKPGDKLVEIKDSSVWDADVDIKEPISQLQFDPRSSTGKAEEVASLEVRKYRCLTLYIVFEFSRGLRTPAFRVEHKTLRVSFL